MTNGRIFSVWLVLLTVLFVPLLAQDEEMRAPDVAWANVKDSLISWDPVQDFNAVTLTVTGSRGLVFQREFPGGTPVVFDLIDNEGNGLPDGHYTWELTGSPALDSWVYGRLAVARETGDESVAEDLRRSGDLPSERFVQSGYFTLEGGVTVVPEEPEADSGWSSRKANPRAGGSFKAAGAAPADQLILDDLIVDGSACIGQDCVNGESFGFDTIRIKENNLRIKAQDTSNSASFPTNDWQITFNESTNGGANKFSIDDIDGGRTPFTIEASAPTNSLYVDDGGRIGLGTGTPVVEVHIKDGDTPTLRLEQDGSSGFTPQTWDVAGNETNFFVRDVTNGSRLPFKIRPSADTNSLVLYNGNVGLGLQSPEVQLHIANSGAGAAGLPRIEMDNTDATEDWIIDVNDADLFRISVDGSGQQEFSLSTAGDLTITGNLVTGGGGTCDPGPCDGTFRSGFNLPTIEEHAAFMWTNSHLWGVGPTPEGEPLNLSKKTTGILHELEVAHIYIERLHRRLTELEAKLAEIQKN